MATIGRSTTATFDSSLEITTRTDRSFLMALLQSMIKPIGQKLITPKKEFPAGSPQLSPHWKAKFKCNIHSRQVAGIWIYDLTAKDSTPSPATTAEGASEIKGAKRKRIYYFAGGGWQMPPSPEHWKLCAELVQRLPNSVVSIISYPLAPNSAAKDSLPALETLYPQLFPSASDDADEEITFAGDSAGGNVVLGLVLDILSKQPSAPAPDKLLVISPTADCRPQPQDAFTLSLPETEKHDPILSIAFTNNTAANWTRGLDPSEPRVSPLFADVRVLRDRGVKLFGITAGNDVLAPPAVAFAEMCRGKGVQGKWLHWEGMMHCFPLAWVYGLSDSKMALEWIVGVLGE